jgi:hypothetical protein
MTMAIANDDNPDDPRRSIGFRTPHPAWPNHGDFVVREAGGLAAR